MCTHTFFFKVDWKFFVRTSNMQNSWMCILNVELSKAGKSTSKWSQDKKDRVAGSECYSWILNWLETFLWTRWAMRLMPCTEECFLPSHTSLKQAPVLVLRAPMESVGQLFPQGRERGGNTCEEHRAGINHAGEVPERAGVPSGVPALAGIEQHRPILTECTKLQLKHSSFLSRIY